MSSKRWQVCCRRQATSQCGGKDTRPRRQAVGFHMHRTDETAVVACRGGKGMQVLVLPSDTSSTK